MSNDFENSDSAKYLLSDSLVNEKNDSSQSPVNYHEITKLTAGTDEFQVVIAGEFYATQEKFINDTFRIEVSVGMNPGDLSFQLNNLLLDEISVEQCAQTSVSIMQEGPHCDLENWLHHTSSWQMLTANNSGSYFLKDSLGPETAMFPEVTADEIKKAAKYYCGSDWNETINTITSVNEYPCIVGVNRLIVRISGEEKVSRKRVVKYLLFVFSMGC
ncbi:MAG: hypothetical protein IM638_17720 [Bacteroidetes bacterium]|nr:hypothetical protein [Bacteroidota bacterium]